jgi:hypothetical protein
MTKTQLYKYRAEWAKVRKALRKLGFTPQEADAMRMTIHQRADAVHNDGAPKSSTTLTNLQFTRILGIFWTYTQAANLDAQAHVVNQVGLQSRWLCKHLIHLINDAAPDTIAQHGIDAYIDSIFKRLNKDCLQDPDWADEPRWWKVKAALTYRYDQVVRARLGRAGETDRYGAKAFAKKRLEFDPSQHPQNMAKIRAMHPHQPAPVQDLETAYTGPLNEGDPF